MKHISPQLGFNNNVRHKGRVFHIQTEDSGIKHPHIITHLFADGGRILKSTKTSYAEFLGIEELPKKVRSLMQEQHKAMFIALRGGKFDHLLGDLPADTHDAAHAAAEASPAAAAAPQAPAPANADAPAHAASPGDAHDAPAPDAVPEPPPPRAPMASLLGAAEFAKEDLAAAEPAHSAPELAMSPTRPALPKPELPKPEPAPDVPPPSESTRPASERTKDRLAAMANDPPPRARLTPPPRANSEAGFQSPLRALAARQSNRPPAHNLGLAHAPTVPKMPSSPLPPAAPAATRESSKPAETRADARAAMSSSIDLDLEALERAAEQTQAPVYRQIRDLPPPPATLLRSNPVRNTSYRSVTPQAAQIVADPKAGASNAPRSPASRPGERGAPAGARGAQQAPASAKGYAPSRPASIFGNSRPTEGASIFGEDLISEKSLDEVILSYLAEDLEGGTPKK